MKKRFSRTLGALLAILASLSMSRPAVAAPNLDLSLFNIHYVTSDDFNVFLKTCKGCPIGAAFCFTCGGNTVHFAAGQVLAVIHQGGNCCAPTVLGVTCLCTDSVKSLSVTPVTGCPGDFDISRLTTNFCGAAGSCFKLTANDTTSSACKTICVTVGGCAKQLELTGSTLSVLDLDGVQIAPDVATAPEVNVRSAGAPVFLSLGLLLVTLDRRRKNVATH